MQERLQLVSIKGPSDYIVEIVRPELQDGCNLSDDENEESECENKSLKTSNSGRSLFDNTFSKRFLKLSIR